MTRTAALLALLLLLAGCSAPTVRVTVPDGGYRWHDALEHYVWCADETDASCRIPGGITAEELRADVCGP